MSVVSYIVLTNFRISIYLLLLLLLSYYCYIFITRLKLLYILGNNTDDSHVELERDVVLLLQVTHSFVFEGNSNSDDGPRQCLLAY